MGEQLESLTFREVQQLEHRIDSALRNVRSRKVHVTCTLIVLQTYRSTVNCYSHRTSVLTVTVQVFFFFFFFFVSRTTSCSTRSRSSGTRQACQIKNLP
jgi:hypothetical protein